MNALNNTMKIIRGHYCSLPSIARTAYLVLFYASHCFNQLLIHRRSRSLIPWPLSLARSPWWGALSKMFLSIRSTPSAVLLNSEKNSKRPVMYAFRLQKPCWFFLSEAHPSSVPWFSLWEILSTKLHPLSQKSLHILNHPTSPLSRAFMHDIVVPPFHHACIPTASQKLIPLLTLCWNVLRKIRRGDIYKDQAGVFFPPSQSLNAILLPFKLLGCLVCSHIDLSLRSVTIGRGPTLTLSPFTLH